MTTNYRRFLPYALREWRALSLIALVTFIYSVFSAAQPWPLKILVDHALKGITVPPALQSALNFLGLPASPAVLILFSAFGSIAVFAIYTALDSALTMLWTVAGQRMVFGLTRDLFHCLQRLSLSFHNRRTVGDSLSRLTVDTWSVYTMTTTVLVSPVRQAIVLATIGGVAWRMDRQLALISFGLAPLLALSGRHFGGSMKQRALGMREAQSRLTAFIQQVLSSIIVVQCFGTEVRNRRRLEALSKEIVRWAQRSAIVNGSYGLANGIITTTGMGLILFTASERVLAGRLSMGSLLVFIAYVRSMQQACQDLLQIFGTLKPVEASLDRILETLEAKERVPDVPHAKILSGDLSQNAILRFENVSFGYDAETPVLRAIDLEARSQEVIALVGETGAGKSTLASLIPRFFDPLEGRITLNGVDIRDLRLAWLRERVSLVLQEPFLQPLTVAENIAYGRPDASRAEVMEAARAANADEFIRRLPKGYDMEIGERGATLSGGQKQRIAIARALLKNAPILILDEPTSALDARTESLIMEAMDSLMAGRMTFIIAHRLSTVRRANQILVLDRGAIVEAGTHDQLLAAGGLYQRLHSLQFREDSNKISA
jgi:ATP-binding cassette, subfamily B, bacterial